MGLGPAGGDGACGWLCPRQPGAWGAGASGPEMSWESWSSFRGEAVRGQEGDAVWKDT